MVLVPKPSKVAYERPVWNLSSLRCPTRYNSKHGLIILIGIILHVQYFFRIGMACMSPMVRHGSLQEHVEKDVNALGMIIDLLWLLQAKGQEKTTCSSHSKLSRGQHVKSQLHETYVMGSILAIGTIFIIFPPAPVESASWVSSSPSVPRQTRFLSLPSVFQSFFDVLWRISKFWVQSSSLSKGWDVGQKKSNPQRWNVVARCLTLKFGGAGCHASLPFEAQIIFCLLTLLTS